MGQLLEGRAVILGGGLGLEYSDRSGSRGCGSLGTAAGAAAAAARVLAAPPPPPPPPPPSPAPAPSLAAWEACVLAPLPGTAAAEGASGWSMTGLRARTVRPEVWGGAGGCFFSRSERKGMAAVLSAAGGRGSARRNGGAAWLSGDGVGDLDETWVAVGETAAVAGRQAGQSAGGPRQQQRRERDTGVRGDERMRTGDERERCMSIIARPWDGERRSARDRPSTTSAGTPVVTGSDRLDADSDSRRETRPVCLGRSCVSTAAQRVASSSSRGRRSPGSGSDREGARAKGRAGSWNGQCHRVPDGEQGRRRAETTRPGRRRGGRQQDSR